MTNQTIYVCFHCKQRIVGDHEAELHFGREPTAKPECWMYPRNIKDILDQNNTLRQFAEGFFNGIDTGLVRVETDADETLANVLSAGRAAIAARQTPVPDHQLDDASPASGHSPQNL